jgi:hypothetical protein
VKLSALGREDKSNPSVHRVPSEHDEQVRVCRFLNAEYPDVYWYAVPNGGRRGIVEAHRLKEEGVRSGVPDLCIAHAMPPWHGLYIEMKKCKGGRVEREQKSAISSLIKAGYRAVVCKGADEAMRIIEEYMGC